ncbi:hypothetical protein ACEQ8H_000910 [Pleosporales sp. CAS-2024a]
MIPPSCAWARVGLRRIPNPPRNCMTGYSASARSRISPSHVTRRYNASKPPSPQKAPEPASTIPGPSWLWLEPIYGPFRAYGRVQQRKPYMTQFISSLVIYFVGDMVAQSIAKPTPKEHAQEEGEELGWVQDWSNNHDWHRTGRALVIGGLSSIPSYRWFIWLGQNFNYSSKVLSLTTKIIVNQTLFTPVFNSYFFGMQSLLSGASCSEIVERLKNTVPTSCYNSWKVWPVVTAFSFTYIPIQYRSIFGGVIAIGWQTYLSLLNQRAAAVEAAEHGADQAHIQKAIFVNRRDEREHEQDGQKCAA